MGTLHISLILLRLKIVGVYNALGANHRTIKNESVFILFFVYIITTKTEMCVCVCVCVYPSHDLMGCGLWGRVTLGFVYIS